MALVLGFKNHATEYVGTNEYDTGEYNSPSVWLTNIPRMKFNWTVEFMLNNPDPEIQELLDGNDLVGSMTNVAKTVQLPDLNFDTQTLNQYNKRRHIHVKGEYQPIQMSFHDNVSGRFEKLLNAYKKFYWASDSYPGLDHIRQRDQTSDQFVSNFGMLAIKNTNDNFFKSIAINREWMGKTDQYLLINPKITAMQHDTLDYASNDTLQWTITVTYEALETRWQQPADGYNRPGLSSLTYASYQSDAQAQAAAGTGLENASNTGGQEPPEGEVDGGFSGEDTSDLNDWNETGVGDASQDSMAAYDEFAGLDEAVAKQEAEKASWKNQLAEKFSSLKENVAGAYQKAQNFSVGGIPVGKAINPQNIGTTVALGTAIATSKGGALKNPAFLLGAVGKVASGIPGASQYMGGITAGVAGYSAYKSGGLKGLATVGAVSAAYWLNNQKSPNALPAQADWATNPSKTPYSPMQSFIGGDGNAANGRRF